MQPWFKPRPRNFMTPHEAAQLKPGDLVFCFAAMTGNVYVGETPNRYELTSPAGSIVRVSAIETTSGKARTIKVNVLTGPGASVVNDFNHDDQAPNGFPFRKLNADEAHVARLLANTVKALSQRYNHDLNGDAPPHYLDPRTPTGDTYNDYDDEMVAWSYAFRA